MLGKIAAFEFRYQIRSPLALTAALVLLAFSFVDMSVDKMFSSGGGNVLYNAPHAIIMSHVLLSLLFLFLSAAFVSNVVLRDEQTGFGPIVRTTRIGKADYLFGRFAGAVGVSAAIMAAVPLGSWLGTLMPFADQAMLGLNRWQGFAYGYGLVALPNALIVSAFLFALATTTRSTAGTFLGVVGFLFVYLLTQRLMEGRAQLSSVGVLADPLGAMSYLASSRYLTAADFNAGKIPVSPLMIWSRALWVGLALAALGYTYTRFSLAERKPSRRQLRQARRAAMLQPCTRPEARKHSARLPDPRWGARAGLAQFGARARLEARFIFASPVFLILLLMAAATTFPSLLSASGFGDVPIYPVTAIAIPLLQQTFGTVLVVIATYYGGELVWRDRERRMHEIIDATPLPAWTLMLPKVLGLTLVLFATVLVAVAVAVAAQLLDGGVDIEPRKYLRWYLLPAAVDAALIATLSVFVQAWSPSKAAGWGVMALYIVLLIFGPSLGLSYPLFIYGSVPSGELFDMSGMGNYAAPAVWFRLFWAALATLLLVGVHLTWPRGSGSSLRERLRHVPARIGLASGGVTIFAGLALLLSGWWIVYNTRYLNTFSTDTEGRTAMAEYERRYFRYASLPQPTVRHVQLKVALYPKEVRADVRGRYRLVNETSAPLSQLHLRLLSPGLRFVAVDLPGAHLERDDAEFAYRIYRLDRPMRPGEVRWLSFHTRRGQDGFRSAGTETRLVGNGTNLSSLELTPRIGMNDMGLLDVPAERRAQGLPERQPFPRLNDVAATRLPPNGDVSWTTADITVSTEADQMPVAPGKLVAQRIEGGRRIVRFVSTAPISNFLLFQSARYTVARRSAGGVEYAVYYHPRHAWNVARILTAMQAAVAYCGKAFGPYQFDQMRIAERPFAGGGQAFPNTVAVSEGVFAMDMRDPATLDMVTLLTAHETAHQWWGHQVKAARMQGAALIGEVLAQYSALMVLKHLKGEENIRQSMAFQVDRYLSGRRTAVLAEQPLISAGLDDDHINYGKGAIAFYLLQKRMGEEAINRALRKFVARYRFAGAPYPRSVDLIAYLRREAGPAEQRLITDLFERITFYDLTAKRLAVRRRADGRWDVAVTVTARKTYADGAGKERPAQLNERIEIALSSADPRIDVADKQTVIAAETRQIRSGTQIVRFVTDRAPTFAVVDPMQLYIDRNIADNLIAAEGS